MIVHEKDLLVHKTALVAVDLDAGSQQLAGVGPVGHGHHRSVRFIGNHHPHVHAPQGGQLQGRDDAVIGHEVGAGDPDTAGGGDDGLVVHEAGLLVFAGRVGGEHQHRAVAFGLGGNVEVYIHGGAGRPAPVRGEGEHRAHYRRPLHPGMGVAPVAHSPFPAQVLVAHVVAAYPGVFAVHDHVLAMVAEIELEAIAPPLRGVEGGNLDPGHLQLSVQAGLGKLATAYLVVQQEYLHPGPGPVRQHPAEALAQLVVADDIELEQDVVTGRFQARHNAVEGLLAVDQQLHLVAGGSRHAGQVEQAGVQRRVTGYGHDMLGHHGTGFANQPQRLLFDLIALFQVAVELVAAEHQVQRYGDIG